MMKFEWDPKKDASNQAKHGLSFDDAQDAFQDEDRITAASPRNGEQRWITIGLVFDFLILVAYTMRGAAVRIISARKATKKERLTYYHHNKKKYESNENNH